MQPVLPNTWKQNRSYINTQYICYRYILYRISIESFSFFRVEMQQPEIIHSNSDSIFIRLPDVPTDDFQQNEDGRFSLSVPLNTTETGRKVMELLESLDRSIPHPISMEFESVYSRTTPLTYTSARSRRNLFMENLVYQSRIKTIHWLRSMGANVDFPPEYEESIRNVPHATAITHAGRESIRENIHSRDMSTDSHTEPSIRKIAVHIDKKDLKTLCKKCKLVEGNISEMRERVSNLTLKDIPDNIVCSIAKKMKLGVRIGNIKDVRAALLSKC